MRATRETCKGILDFVKFELVGRGYGSFMPYDKSIEMRAVKSCIEQVEKYGYLSLDELRNFVDLASRSDQSS